MRNDINKIVVGIIALFVTIGIGSMIFYQIIGSQDRVSSESQYEEFAGYGVSANATTTNVTLSYWPETVTNVTCYNASDGLLSYPSYNTDNTELTVQPAANNYSQINTTYDTQAGTIGAKLRSMGSTVFGLAVLIGLVVVASVIITAVSRFGEG